MRQISFSFSSIASNFSRRNALQSSMAKLYNKNVNGTVDKCQRECASNAQNIGGKSFNSNNKEHAANN